MRYINLINSSDNKPRKKISVDECSYTVTTEDGESQVVIPGSRTFASSDFFVLDANGIKLHLATHFTIVNTTTIQAETCEMFPTGKFPKNCILNFELYTIS